MNVTCGIDPHGTRIQAPSNARPSRATNTLKSIDGNQEDITMGWFGPSKDEVWRQLSRGDRR